MKHEAIITASPAPEAAGAEREFLEEQSCATTGCLFSLLLIMALLRCRHRRRARSRRVNVTNLILQNSYIVIMALGMLLVIVGGNIDLSVGSIVGFVGARRRHHDGRISCALARHRVKVPWQLGHPAVALILGGLIGAAQGYFVAYSKIPSFIVTLGGMLIFRGLTGNMLLGQFVGPFAKAFQAISAGFIPDFSDFGHLQAAVRTARSSIWRRCWSGSSAPSLLIVTGAALVAARQRAGDGDASRSRCSSARTPSSPC